MPMVLVFVLKWVKSVLRCTLYIFHLSLWATLGPYLTKFCNLDKNGHFNGFTKHLKILSLLWQLLNALGQIIIVENGQMLPSGHIVYGSTCSFFQCKVMDAGQHACKCDNELDEEGQRLD